MCSGVICSYGGLLHLYNITQIFQFFIFFISILIRAEQLISFYPRKVLISNSYFNIFWRYNLITIYRNYELSRGEIIYFSFCGFSSCFLLLGSSFYVKLWYNHCDYPSFLAIAIVAKGSPLGKDKLILIFGWIIALLLS